MKHAIFILYALGIGLLIRAVVYAGDESTALVVIFGLLFLGCGIALRILYRGR